MKKDYFTQLTRAARWLLPPEEAREVLAEYRLAALISATDITDQMYFMLGSSS